MQTQSVFEPLTPRELGPFILIPVGQKVPTLRALTTPEGLADRLRFVAFAELQASLAFYRAADRFPDLNPEVKKIWMTLAREERKHLFWLIARIDDLGFQLADRPVSDALWSSFQRCESPVQFAQFMANAEDRGKIAGEQFYQTLLKLDPITANLFQQIATEEAEHIRLAKTVTDQNFQIPPHFDPKVEGLPLQQFLGSRSVESIAGQFFLPF